MSPRPVIGFVCEGATDLPVLQAVVDAILGRDYVTRSIQPETDNLGSPSGWTAVKAWCERFGAQLEHYLTSFEIDLLVIQVDADVARKMGAKTTADVCQAVKRWLGPGARDGRLLVAVPAQATDTWLLAACAAVNPKIEDEPHPARALVKQKVLEADADGKPRKHVAAYRRAASRITSRIVELRRTLPELERFAGKLEVIAQSRLGHPAPIAADATATRHRAKRRG